MKTIFKTIVILLTFACLSPFLTSCGDDEPGGSSSKKQLIGSWEIGTTGNIYILTFKSDGSFTWDDDWSFAGHGVSRSSGRYSYDSSKEILVLNYNVYQDQHRNLSHTYFILLLDNSSLSWMDHNGDIATWHWK